MVLRYAGCVFAASVSCAVVMPEGAVLIGFVAGIVYNLSSVLLLKLQVRPTRVFIVAIIMLFLC